MVRPHKKISELSVDYRRKLKPTQLKRRLIVEGNEMGNNEVVECTTNKLQNNNLKSNTTNTTNELSNQIKGFLNGTVEENDLNNKLYSKLSDYEFISNKLFSMIKEEGVIKQNEFNETIANPLIKDFMNISKEHTKLYHSLIKEAKDTKKATETNFINFDFNVSDEELANFEIDLSDLEDLGVKVNE